MSLGHGPKIITDGLVFAYDMGPNPGPNKSWKGAPITNLYADGDYSSGVLHPVRSGTWSIVADPRNNAKKVLKATPSANNQYHGRDIPVTASSVYSLQMEIYVSPDFNGTNVQMYPEQGGGGANRSYNLSNKGTWQLLKFDGKTATTANIRMLAYVLSSFTTGYVLISNVQVELNSFATPFVNGTRSNTQALLDWTGNNTITANSLTYNSDGTFSFNGSSNVISFPENSALNVQNPTIEVWVKTNALTQNGFWFEKGNVNTQYSFFQEGSNIQWRTHNGSGYVTQSLSSSNISTSNYSQCVATIENGQKKIYINGVSKASVAWSSTIPTNANGCSIGAYGGFNGGRSYYYNGNIGSVKVYNRALTAAEIAQNFQALRGRYGI